MNKNNSPKINNLYPLYLKTKQTFYDTSQVLFYSLIFSHLTFIPYAHAGPAGGQVVGGAGSISQTNLNTIINQTSGSMAINWDSYNLNSNERVQYIQPNSSSLSLNRILSNSGSQINGRIDANGQVILVNPNGVFFGATSQINVGGLIASGLDISPTDFMNGNYIFNEVLGSNGTVINSGLINASLGGNVSLIGKQVKNEGVINAHLGAVNMAAGKQAVLTFDTQGLIGVKITKEILQNELGIDPALINSGEINAESGKVLLTASVSRDVFSQAVNTGNIEQATSVLVNNDGSFSLGAGADVLNSGVVNVSTNENNTAGDIVVIGENITHTGVISADVNSGTAGNIELHANDKTELRGTALITAQASENGSGGDVKILGDKIGLFDTALINASGANAGGRVLVGGDKQGLNNNIRNAEFLFLGEESKIFADATLNGDGGKIITYANDTSRFFGELYARGGVLAGDGGFIETSGKRGFQILNAPDVSANAGQGGLWLIDPYNITIQNGDGSNDFGFTPSATTVYTSSGTPAVIEADTIITALGSGDVEIFTDGTDLGVEAGNINFTAALDYNNTGSNTLTLNADGAITFQSASNILDSNDSGDSLSVSLFANDGVTLASGVIIDTQGGNFIVGGAGGNTPSSFDSTGATIDTSGRPNTAAGNINIDTSGAITTDTLTANGGSTSSNSSGSNAGSITLNGTGQVIVNGAVQANGTNGLNSGGGGDNEQYTGGNGGPVSITSTGSTVTIDSTISSIGGSADGDAGENVNGGNAGSILLSSQAGAGTVTLTGDITSSGGADFGNGTQGTANTVTVTGNTILTSNITIDTDGFDNGSSGGNVNLNGTVTNTIARTLTIDSGTANTTVTDDVGTGIALQTFTISEADQVNVSAIRTSSSGTGVSINAADSITLGGNINTATAADAGSLTLNGNIILDGNSISLNTNGTNSDTAINIAGNINADLVSETRSLTLNAGTQSVTLNNVGDSQAIQGLTVTAASTTNLNNNVRTKESGVNIASTTINVDGDISTDNNPVSNAGSVTLTGATNLLSNVTIDTDAAAGTDGAVLFNGTGTVDSSGGNNTLEIIAGGGDVTFVGAAGVGQDLQSLTITSANTVLLNEVNTLVGGVDITGNDITLGGDILTDGENDAGDVTIVSNTNDITLASNVLIDTVNTSSDGFIRITGDINADSAVLDRTLTLESDTQDITINGDIGATQAILYLDILDANDVSLDAVNTRSVGVLIDADTVTLGGNINTTRDGAAGGAVDIAGSDSSPLVTAVTLDGNVTITTNSTTDGLVSIAGDVNNNGAGTAFDFAIDAGATALNLNDIGSAQAVRSFTVTNSTSTSAGEIGTAGGVVNINTAGGADAIVLSGDIITNNTNVANAGGAVTLTGPVRLDSDVSINTNGAATDGAVTFTSTVNASNISDNRLLTIDAGTGNVTFTGLVGNLQALQKLTVTSANNVFLSAVNTNGGGANRGARGVSITANSMTLNGNINTASENDAGDVTLNVGANTITLANDSTINTNGVDSDGAINITGNITATTNSPAAESLILDAGLDADADITVNGTIGSGFALNAFTIDDAETVSIDGVNTRDGGVTITNATSVGLGGNINTTFGTAASGNVSITAPIILEADTSITTNHLSGTDAAIILNELDGNSNLLLDSGSANVTFNNNIGDTTALTGLTVINTATTNINGDINTRNNGVNITSGAINLGGNISTITGGTAGAVLLNGPVNLTNTSIINTNATNDANVTFFNNVNGANELTVDAGAATVDFQGLVGNTAALNSLNITNAGLLNLNSVLTRSGGININSNLINLSGNLSSNAEASNAGNILLNGNVRLNNNIVLNTNRVNDGSVTITGTVDSFGTAQEFTISSGDANVDLQSALGGANALSLLDINSSGSAGDLNLNSVRTTAGNINVAANQINLQGTLDTTDGVVTDVATGNITIDGEVVLAGTTVLNTDAAASTSDGLIAFTGRVSGAQDLDVTSGQANVQFQDIVGQDSSDVISGLNRFFVNSGIANAGNATLNTVITSNGGIDVTGSLITLNGDLRSDFTGTAGNINLTGNTRIANDIRIDSGSTTSASITINGNVTADSAIQNRVVTFSAGDQNITVNGILGNSSNSLGGVVVEDANNASFDNIETQNQGIDITATNIELGGNLFTIRDSALNSGDINLTGDITLVSGVNFYTYGSASSGDITVIGDINADSASNNRYAYFYSNTGDIDIQGDMGTGADGTLYYAYVIGNTGATASVRNINTGSIGTYISADDINISGSINSNGFADAGSIQLSALDSINFNADTTLNSNAVGNDQNIFISAASINANNNNLILNSGSNNTFISTAVTNAASFDVQESSTSTLNGVSVNTAGSLNINASDAVNLTGDYVSGTGLLSFNADMDGNRTGLLTINDNATFTTVDNDISFASATLTDGNSVTINSGANGQVLFNSTGDISLGNAISGMNISNDLVNNVIANNVLLNANDALNVDGANVTQDLSFVTTNGNINFTGAASSLQTLLINTVNDVLLGATVTSANEINITANNINSNAAGGLTSSTSDITLAGNLTGTNTLNLTATNGSVDLQATTINSLDSLNIDADNILFSNITPVVTDNDIDLTIRTTNAQYEQQVDLTSTNGQVSVTTTNADLVFNSATTVSAQDAVNLTANNGNIALSTVNVAAGSINVNAANGAITDNNTTQTNLTASTVVMNADSGIGTNSDAIETVTSELNVSNNGTGTSTVDIANTGDVLITNLVNSGNINFTNDTNVTINNVDAGFTVGLFQMDVANGSVFGVDRGGADFFTIPDITADTAFITVNGEFGTFERPIVLKLNSEFFLASTVSSTFFLGGPPPVNNDTSALQISVFDSINSVSGQQLIEVESIADIDPAIFTELRNYNEEDIAIRLPRDQVFEDELETYDRLQ